MLKSSRRRVAEQSPLADATLHCGLHRCHLGLQCSANCAFGQFEVVARRTTPAKRQLAVKVNARFQKTKKKNEFYKLLLANKG